MSFFVDSYDDDINATTGEALANLKNPFVLNVVRKFANILTPAQLQALHTNFLEIFDLYLSDDALPMAKSKVPIGGLELVHTMINMKHFTRAFNQVRDVITAVEQNAVLELPNYDDDETFTETESENENDTNVSNMPEASSSAKRARNDTN